MQIGKELEAPVLEGTEEETTAPDMNMREKEEEEAETTAQEKEVIEVIEVIEVVGGTLATINEETAQGP